MQTAVKPLPLPTTNDHHPSIPPHSSTPSLAIPSTLTSPCTSSTSSSSIHLNHHLSSLDNNWNQIIDLEAGDLQASITLYKVSSLARYLYCLIAVVSLGLLPLVFQWVPKYWLFIFGHKINLLSNLPLASSNNIFVLLHNSWDQFTVCKLQSVLFNGQCMNVFHTSNSSIMPSLFFFKYRALTYIWNLDLNLFLCTANWKDQHWATMSDLSNVCLSDQTIRERQLVFGPNSVLVPDPSNFELIVHEILHPFTVFQVFSIILWSLNTYYWYALAVGLITIVSAISTLRQTKQNIKRLRKLGKQDHQVTVLKRNNVLCTQPSDSLVPGDIIRIDHAVPEVLCDMMILTGDAVVDESMLTGEAVPVGKVAGSIPSLLNPDCLFANPTFPEHMSKSILFQGTKLIRARGVNSQAPFALVLRTGFNTAKGSLIKSMMYPQPHSSAMVRDAFRFLAVLTVFGVIGMCYALTVFINRGVSLDVIIIRSLDVFTLIVPPALPATLSAGISFALNRLRPQSIFCTSPNHITKAGQIRTVVFDKTGTITEDGLEVVGVIPATTCDLVCDANLLTDHRLVIGMAVCHDVKHLHPSLVETDPDGQLVGDPLDVKMVEWIGATIHDCINAGVHVSFQHAPLNEYGQIPILRVFKFSSSLRRMAVLIKTHTAAVQVFVKGAPEAIESICLPQSIPSNYKALIDDYAHHGLRVLAIATRELSGPETSDLSSQARPIIESNLTFIGFVVFENPLKPGSRFAIEKLRSASIRCLMCTGDNLVTAVSVARKTRMLDLVDRVYVPMVVPVKGVVAWVAHDDPNDILPGTLHHLHPGMSLAMTGDVFDLLVHQNRVTELNMILKHGVVFARMAPEHKRELVELLRNRNFRAEDGVEGIAFCGDGANDCAALKAADVGLSLSDAEASIAAPFTSAERDLSCVITLIQEGRAALVTTHSCFKFMSCYSMCQFTSVCILYSIGSNLGDFQFLYIDIVLVLPLALSMARSEASSSLSPAAPPSRLMSKPILFTVISSMMLQMGLQLLMFFMVQLQPWYTAPDVNPEFQIVTCHEGTSLYFLSCFMYMAMAVCFAAGEPYRTNPMRNYLFLAVLLTVLLGTVILANVANDNVRWFFDVMPLYNGWQWNILGLACMYAGLVLMIEHVSSKLSP